MGMKIGDVISYEPTAEWTEAQEMWGSIGVVRELLPLYPFNGKAVDCIKVDWLHAPKSDHWNDMILTETNCKKIGEVGEVVSVPV